VVEESLAEVEAEKWQDVVTQVDRDPMQDVEDLIIKEEAVEEVVPQHDCSNAVL
jgi:hypothetical protein